MAKKWIWIFSLFFLIVSNSYAQTSGGGPNQHSPTLSVTDGVTTCYPYQISVGSVTSCANGVATIATGGGGGVGVGTINTGSQFQVGYYATAGTTLSGSSILSVNSSNVGIGSINPQQKLDVNGSIILSNSSGGTITTLQSIAGAQSKDLTITTGVSGTQTGNIGIGPQSGASVNGDINIIGQGTSGQTKGSDITITAGNGSAHKGIISITAPGNVGIGTIFPIQALDVIGTTRMTSFLMPTGASSGYVLTSNSVGLGTWAPSTGVSGSGTVGSGTINQEAVYTGSTTTGSGIITDNGTNIGIGTSSNTQAKLDVNGDISIRNNLSSVTAGQFKGVGAVWYPAWPGSGIEPGISSKKAPYDNSFSSTSNGATGAMGLWSCNDHTQYDIYFSGVTQVPLSGAIYTNGSFNYHIKSSYITSGTSGSYVGVSIATAAGDLSAASGTLTLSSGTGDATLTYTSWDFNGCNGSISLLGGLTQIGDESNPQYNSPALQGIEIVLDGNPANRMRPTTPGSGIDSAVAVADFNISPQSSGASIGFIGVDATGAIFDRVAMDWTLVKSNAMYAVDPGYGLWVGNSGSTNMKGFVISSPGVAGISGDTGNTPFYVGDSVHQKSRFGFWQKFIATPDDVVYQFNGITGLSVLPSAFGSQYTISGDRCDVRDTSGISGGAGNIIMVCQGGAPSASGTLVRLDTAGPAGVSYVSTGDATIAYTSVTKLRAWNDTLLIDQLNNRVGVGTSAPTQLLDVVGTVNALTFNKMIITAPSSSSTLTVANGKTLTVNNTLTLAGTDSTTMTFPSTTATIARTDAANTFTGHQTIEGVTSTGATGTGNLVFGTSPTLVTPALGTPASGVATNLTGTAASLTSGITNALASATTTVNVSSATAPSSGQVLTATSSTAATWQPASGGASGWTLGASNVGISTTNNVGIGTNLTTMAALTVMSGNVGIGTWIPSAPLDIVGSGNAYFGGNVGIGSLAPNASLDLGTSGTIVSHRTTGLGFSDHNATNQACNTTCGSSACVIGLDIGTVGVVNSGFVACTDASADDCLCAGP